MADEEAQFVVFMVLLKYTEQSIQKQRFVTFLTSPKCQHLVVFERTTIATITKPTILSLAHACKIIMDDYNLEPFDCPCKDT